MPDEPRLTYWDAASFTSYVNGDEQRLPHLELIVDTARPLIRAAMVSGLALKAADAIHLATAKHGGAAEVQTYDDKP